MQTAAVKPRETWWALELRATTLTAGVLIVGLAALFLVTAARGENRSSTASCCSSPEVTHHGAVALLNRRS